MERTKSKLIVSCPTMGCYYDHLVDVNYRSSEFIYSYVLTKDECEYLDGLKLTCPKCSGILQLSMAYALQQEIIEDGKL